MCNKTVTGFPFYHTRKVLQTNLRKLEKSIFSNGIPKTFKDVKFTVDGSVFQTFVTLSSVGMVPNFFVDSRFWQEPRFWVRL